ncbi:MAG: UvrD-helicase domain-containing protein, partial [Coprobacillus sp.]|nr:UvrD-helicase domain-containing protein [Coprobacillus sp.]
MAELGERYQAAKQALFNAYYETKLNPQQREAVCTVNGPLLILAGAGSGKTTVLVRRIVHIIKYGNAYYSDRLPPDLCEESVRDMERAAALPPEEIEYILPEFIADPCPPWAVLAITFTNKAARE